MLTKGAGGFIIPLKASRFKLEESCNIKKIHETAIKSKSMKRHFNLSCVVMFVGESCNLLWKQYWV